MEIRVFQRTADYSDFADKSTFENYFSSRFSRFYDSFLGLTLDHAGIDFLLMVLVVVERRMIAYFIFLRIFTSVV
jgi:hypothetical protein